jgi:hypothetical protein
MPECNVSRADILIWCRMSESKATFARTATSPMTVPSNSLAQMSQAFLSQMNLVNEALKSLQNSTTHKSRLKDWHEDMLYHLAAEVELNAGRMYWLLEHREQSLPTLAYLVRNLLELNVWIKYCCKSEKNAQRFYQDRWRDGKGFQKAVENLMCAIPTAADTSPIQTALGSLTETLDQTALAAGISSLDDDYKRVTNAAGEIGIKKFFVATNTLLSKFAHPTAMTVLSFITGEPLDRMFAFFFSVGIGLATAACQTLTKYINQIGGIA